MNSSCRLGGEGLKRRPQRIIDFSPVELGEELRLSRRRKQVSKDREGVSPGNR